MLSCFNFSDWLSFLFLCSASQSTCILLTRDFLFQFVRRLFLNCFWGRFLFLLSGYFFSFSAFALCKLHFDWVRQSSILHSFFNWQTVRMQLFFASRFSRFSLLQLSFKRVSGFFSLFCGNNTRLFMVLVQSYWVVWRKLDFPRVQTGSAGAKFFWLLRLWTASTLAVSSTSVTWLDWWFVISPPLAFNSH